MEPNVASAPTSSSKAAPPSFLKSIALAVGTLALSTWALGTLWLQASRADALEIAVAATE